MDLCELNQMREQVTAKRAQVRRLLSSPDSGHVVRLYDSLGVAEDLLHSPMVDVPEDDRPVTGVEDWIRGLLVEGITGG